MKADKKENKKTINGAVVPFDTNDLMDALKFDVYKYTEKNDVFKSVVD